MRRLILVLAFIGVCVSGFAQKLTKEERAALREQRRAEREERWRIQDSIYQAEVAQEMERSFRKTYAFGAEKEYATDVVAECTLALPDAMHTIARALIDAGYMINVDKEYNTITTEQTSCEGATYSLYFRFYPQESGCKVKACGYAYGNVGIAMYGIVHTSMRTIKVENRGAPNAPFRVIFAAYEKALLSLPDAKLTYIKE